MISFEIALKIHRILIDQFGGTTGLRDKSLLLAALERPYQTFENKDLYPTAIDKASALIESLVRNHPFIDGNKRLGYVLMRIILLENHMDISADQDSRYEFVMGIANGNLSFEKIRGWIEHNSQSR